jgi:hypothetical protein
MAEAKPQSKETPMTNPTATATAPAEKVAEVKPAKAKAPAKAAPAKAATEAKATKPAIRWSYEQERGTAGPQTGASPSGVYRISKDGDKWLATVERDNGKQTVLGQGISHGAAYARCVTDFKAQSA